MAPEELEKLFDELEIIDVGRLDKVRLVVDSAAGFGYLSEQNLKWTAIAAPGVTGALHMEQGTFLLHALTDFSGLCLTRIVFPQLSTKFGCTNLLLAA